MQARRITATQAIRGGANREVLQRIKESGDIFFAISDRKWFLNGANVHISLIGFDNGSESHRILDEQHVASINVNLTAIADVTQAMRLKTNFGICYIGTKKAGKFEISDSSALQMLHSPNPHGKPNSDVLRPWLSGGRILKRPQPQWIIDPGTTMALDEFSLYELPYSHVESIVRPERAKNNRPLYRDKWWLHAETRPGMRRALQGLPRYLATTAHAKYRLFVWASEIDLPDGGVFVFANDNDYYFGILQSRVHEVWAPQTGTHLEDRPRYTPTTCFETFPFPDPTPEQREAIAEAARVLDTLRRNWLNPPEWTREEILEFPGSVDGPWARYVHDAGSRGIGTVRYPRLVPKDAILAQNLVKRTLTNLYNERPAWLDNAHRKLDAAVFSAYGWDADLTDEQILENLLELNLTVLNEPQP